MAATLHRATLALQTPLGTPLAGDTLFGQLCWALRETAGTAELSRRLVGYTHGEPWLVASDGFPVDHLPRPALPQGFLPISDAATRKAAKKCRWIPAHRVGQPLVALLASAVDESTAYGARRAPVAAMQAHNTLNRLSGTTGQGEFAPYTQPLVFHAARQAIDVYLVLDPARVAADEARMLLDVVGTTGFGRDASTGLGKFSVREFAPARFSEATDANACWTLAPCAPQGLGFDGERSYWRVLTRFGRHGNALALAANAFKTPVLLAASGAVLVPGDGDVARAFVGQGLGGHGELSKAEPATVHQGYAPVLPITLESMS